MHKIDPTELVAAVRAFFRNYLQKQTQHQAQIDLEGQVQERTAELAAMNQHLQAEIAAREQSEVTLRESERRFRAIFEQTFQFIGLLKTDGTLLEANQTALDFGGITRQQVIDRPFWQAYWWCISPETQTQLQAAIQEAATGKFIRYKVEVQGKDSIRATIDFSLKPLRNESGQVTLLIAEGRDITELEQAQAALRLAHAELEQRVAARTMELVQANQALQQEITDRQQAQSALQDSQSRLRSFVEANVIGMLFGTTTGGITEANDKFLDMIGYSREELELGQIDWLELTPLEFLPLDDIGIAEAKATGTCTPYEKEYIRKDGSHIPVLVGYVLLGQERNQSVAFILDLTERKQVEQERQHLLEQETTARRKAEELNRLKDEFIATVSHELRTPLNAILGWARLLQTRQFNEATVNRALETIERNANSQAQLVEDLLEVSRLIRGKIELNVRSVDLASVIQSALSTMLLAAEAKRIRLQFFCPTQVTVSGDADRLQQVIWNLLSNAIKFTPEGGSVEVQLLVTEPGQTDGSGTSQAELQPHSLQPHSLQPHSLQPHPLPAHLVQQTNSFARGEGVKPLPGGEAPKPPMLQSLVFATLDNDNGTRAAILPAHAVIQVIDTGQGIAPEFLPYVFDRFRQADGSTTRLQGGLGLGLAIVQQLVELHGGKVFVSSAGKDKGTTFTVKLPLTAVSSAFLPDQLEHPVAQPDRPGSHLPTEFPNLDGVRVLAVDDEADARELIHIVLQQCGAAVTVAASTEEALFLLDRNSYDILLSDIGMPLSDGYDLIQQLRATASGKNAQIPAIALTAYARIEDRLRVLHAGFQNHVPKPVEPIELAVVVANLVNPSRSPLI